MPVTILLQQRILTRGQGRVFPHNHRSVSAAFTRACNKLKIEDLHFHDLRHEGTSRLFEAGLTIEKVALVLLSQKAALSGIFESFMKANPTEARGLGWGATDRERLNRVLAAMSRNS